jgi:hypothetical protein
MWHPDIIHAVEDRDSAQLHPANVVYTAALPMCPLNARYVALICVTRMSLYYLPPFFLALNPLHCFLCIFFCNLTHPLFSATLFDNVLHSLTVSSLPTFVRALQKKRAVSSCCYHSMMNNSRMCRHVFIRFTETNHPERRTSLKDLVSVGRRMMYAIATVLPILTHSVTYFAGALKSTRTRWILRRKSYFTHAIQSYSRLFSSIQLSLGQTPHIIPHKF